MTAGRSVAEIDLGRASIMPSMPSAKTCSATMVIAEK
jgi:hypothetical protein